MATISPPTEAYLSPKYNKEAVEDSSSRPASQVSNSGSQDLANTFNPDWRFVVAFSSLSIITLMAALDATSISVALPIMARVLNGTAIEAFWAGTSFLLTSTVFQPVLGKLFHDLSFLATANQNRQFLEHLWTKAFDIL